jgi:hypothetical protein
MKRTVFVAILLSIEGFHYFSTLLGKPKFSNIPFLLCTFRGVEVVASIVHFSSLDTDPNILWIYLP